jgi:hypothetical protein
LGEAVLRTLVAAGAAPAKFELMAANRMLHSGKPDELLARL